MSFLNPFLLLGLAAVSVPVIIHLLNRRKFQRVVWAAMRFVRISVEQNQKRMRIEDLILLILRCALLFFLALALARPAWQDTAARAFGLAKVTAVVLLDNSGSMGMNDGVETRFEQARKAAEQVVDALPSGSDAAVFLASDAAQPLVPEPTHDLNLARKVIREAPLSDRSSDLFPPLEKAVETLRGRASLQKEIYLITDGQAGGWRQAGDMRKLIERVRNEGRKENLRVHVILVGRAEERNLGVSELSLATGLSPVNRPLRFEVRVSNHGAARAENVKVSLQIGGGAPVDQLVIPEIPPGSARNASLFGRFPAPGWHEVAAAIDSDRLPFDDRRVMAVNAIKEVNILLVDGDPGTEPRDAETFFLGHALTPVPLAERETYFVKPRVVTAAEVGGIRFDDFDAVVLANVGELTVAQANLLERFVRRGGGLMVFPGAKLNERFYNEQLATVHELLPARFGPAVGDEKQDEVYAKFDTRNYDHPIVSLWQDEGAGTLASARFYRHFPLLAHTNSAAATNEISAGKVVLRFADGTPAMMERAYGLGRVVQFASTADIAWNDLPVRPAVVPLLHRALAALVQQRDSAVNLPVGQPFVRRMNAEFIGRDATVIGPRHEGDARDLARIEMVNGLPLLQYPATDRGGLYETTVNEPPLVLKFAAQPDPAESSLAEISEADLEEIQQVATVTRWSPLVTLRQMVEQQRVGAEFWLPLVILVLLLAGAETFLQQWFSRSK